MAKDRIQVSADHPERQGYCLERDILSGKTMLKKIGAGIEDPCCGSAGELA